MLLDNNLLFALSVERFLDYKEPLRRKTGEGWQLFLAEARKRFLVDELIVKNQLRTENLDGEILEIDSGPSQLNFTLDRSGIRTKTIDLNFSGAENNNDTKFALGVSHNQLEHFSDRDSLEKALSLLAQRSVYGMVHQIHAVDDPGFGWDNSHNLRLRSSEWEDYLKNWATDHTSEGWVYLGAHRGIPGRPQNFVLERNGSLPFYTHYDEQVIRRVIKEATIANGISISRLPLLLFSFSIAGDNPYLLAGLVGAIHALDGLDGYAARKGLGNSPGGPLVDIVSDHVVESAIFFQYAYSKGYIPAEMPWIVTARNLSVDFLRFYNAFRNGIGTPQAHPHESFGTNGTSGRIKRVIYGVTKALGDMIIPVVPQLGLTISAVHIGESFARALPVWTSSTSQRIYREVLDKVLSKK